MGEIAGTKKGATYTQQCATGIGGGSILPWSVGPGGSAFGGLSVATAYHGGADDPRRACGLPGERR